MFNKYTSIIVLISFQFILAECTNGLIEINEKCYNKKHIDVLQDFIDLNPSLKGLEPEKIGYQEWNDNKLTYLYLGKNNITSLPDSIGLLKDLITLDLRDNQIEFLPEGICSIYPFYAKINFDNNKICPEYPYCIDYLDNQNTNECENFNCSTAYTQIGENCYKKEHLQILQSIIDINASLKDYTPLDIAKEIGLLEWENGDIVTLNLVGHELTSLPESLCSIYKNLKYFDVSNNSICPPYPNCFEFIGLQNTSRCADKTSMSNQDSNYSLIDNRNIIFNNKYNNVNLENFQFDLSVIQEFVNKNESLSNLNPLEVGIQKWTNMRLTYLDLSNLDIAYVPIKFCDIYPNLTFFNFDNNSICPPYPQCIDYIGNQNQEPCGKYLCPDNYIEYKDECYYKQHVDFLNELINVNSALLDTTLNFSSSMYNLTSEHSIQHWHNGKLDKLILSGLGLTTLTDDICKIYDSISVLEISNNSICPPYPDCFDFIGYQNLDDCESNDRVKLSCPLGYVEFDGTCYYYNDIDVLIDITKENSKLVAHHPLLLGYQLWENGRIISLGLDGLKIDTIPSSIKQLNLLKNLNLNNNNLTSLPLDFCDIYPNLDSFQIDNNYFCPPYLACFDYIGNQNLENCESSFCPYNYLEIDEKCYFKRDINVLRDLINQNSNLKNYNILDVGIQKWKNRHLDYLYLGASGLKKIPESFCDIIKDVKVVNISQNEICPPYPNCIEFLIGEQNTSNCP